MISCFYFDTNFYGIKLQVTAEYDDSIQGYCVREVLDADDNNVNHWDMPAIVDYEPVTFRGVKIATQPVYGKLNDLLEKKAQEYYEEENATEDNDTDIL